MYKTLKKHLLIFFVFLLFFMGNVCAIVCEYPNIGLNITYNSDAADADKFRIDYSNFNVHEGYSNFLLFKYGQSSYGTDELSINQELFKKYEGYACPTGMYVCEYYHSSADLPSIKNLGYTIQNIFSGSFNKESYAVFTINEKKLYVMTYEEFKNSKLPRYIGGFVSDSVTEAGQDTYEKVKSWCGIPFLCDAFGGVAAVGGGLLSAVKDSTVGDGIEVLFYKEAVCNVADYTGPYFPIDVNCIQFTQKIFEYRDVLAQYIECEDNAYCKAKSINELNDVEDGLKKYCSTILESYDYNEIQKGCIDACLNVKEMLDEHKKGTDLEEKYVFGECGFSARLLVWASNILRWIKYILPVFVIILSILDFIKAIGADKDDEMKKAQKKFITRLIAAALTFIIPLIIEFVLNKMGFGYDSCGLF